MIRSSMRESQRGNQAIIHLMGKDKSRAFNENGFNLFSTFVSQITANSRIKLNTFLNICPPQKWIKFPKIHSISHAKYLVSYNRLKLQYEDCCAIL